MIRGEKLENNRTRFKYEKCYGMSVTTVIVNTDWFESQDLTNLDGEQLYQLAHQDKEHSKVDAICRWYGLG